MSELQFFERDKQREDLLLRIPVAPTAGSVQLIAQGIIPPSHFAIDAVKEFANYLVKQKINPTNSTDKPRYSLDDIRDSQSKKRWYFSPDVKVLEEPEYMKSIPQREKNIPLQRTVETVSMDGIGHTRLISAVRYYLSENYVLHSATLQFGPAQEEDGRLQFPVTWDLLQRDTVGKIIQSNVYVRGTLLETVEKETLEAITQWTKPLTFIHL